MKTPAHLIYALAKLYADTPMHASQAVYERLVRACKTFPAWAFIARNLCQHEEARNILNFVVGK